MKTFERSVEPFVVSGESAEARGPGEASLDHPAAWQQHESALGHWVFDYFEPDAVALGRLGRGVAGVALINVGHLHGAARARVHVLGQRLHLSAIALVGGCNP